MTDFFKICHDNVHALKHVTICKGNKVEFSLNVVYIGSLKIRVVFNFKCKIAEKTSFS